MKKFYTTLFLSAMTLFVFAQEPRKASLSGLQTSICKTCIPQITVVNDTMCNLEADDTLTVYYADAKMPFDSGFAYGHNAYQDMAWAERFTVSGSANVIGGAYLFYSKSGSAASSGAGTGQVYTISGTDGKPETSLGSANIPFSSMSLVPPASTFFTFSAPVPVTNSFFMVFELGTYTFGGADTIGIVTSKSGNRSTSNNDQNCAKWSDGKWYFEATENFEAQLNYGLCAIVDVAGGVNDYVSKGDLKLYAAYPNPSLNGVNINYSIENASNVVIEIFDAQGKSIVKVNKGKLSAGTHLEKFDASSFGAGNYFYSVSSETGTLFSRFSIE